MTLLDVSTYIPHPDEASLSDCYPGDKLLTAVEEQCLYDVLRAAQEARSQLVAGVPPVVSLFVLVLAGLAARDRFVNSNVRLVVAVARRHGNTSVPLRDLVQEGMFGLLRAIEKYDGRGRFSTYATWWIRQAITRSLAETGRLIRLPVHLHEALYRLRQAERRHLAETGRAPSDDDLAAALQMPLRKIKHLRTVKAQFAGPAISLDETIGESDELDAYGYIPSDDDPAAEAIAAADGSGVRALLGLLSERERRVLELRHGFDRAGEPRTLNEVAAELEPPLTRERVRQIEAHALETLRAYAEARGMAAVEG